jgi:hypothetical protein
VPSQILDSVDLDTIDYDNMSREEINDILKPRLEAIEKMSAKKQSDRKRFQGSTKDYHDKTNSTNIFPAPDSAKLVERTKSMVEPEDIDKRIGDVTDP